MNYCGIKRIPAPVAQGDSRNLFNASGAPYESLGSRIRSSLQYGTDVGSPVVVQFDSPDSEEVDVLTDPNHDFFDIAEQYQQEVKPVAPVPDAPKGDTGDGVNE